MRSDTAMKRRLFRLAGGTLLCLIIAACGTSTPSRDDVLADLAEGVIVPGYERLRDVAQDLETATSALCATPSVESLSEARGALAAGRDAWSYTEAMWVGPVMDRRSWATIDWPIDAEQIESLIADTSVELDHDRLSRRIGADQRGLKAVEYILGDKDAVVSGLDGRQCRYLTGIAAVIVEEAQLVSNDWAESWEGGEPYRAVLAANPERSIDAIVNDTVFLLDAIVDAELGAALGKTNDEPDTEAILEGAAGLGSDDLRSHLRGLWAIFVGTEATPGLSPLFSNDLRERLGSQFDNAEAALNGIAAPLRTQIAEAPEQVLMVRGAFGAIRVTVSTEVVATLGVTIGFSDADGDSG